MAFYEIMYRFFVAAQMPPILKKRGIKNDGFNIFPSPFAKGGNTEFLLIKFESFFYIDTDITLPYKLWAKDRRKTGDIP
jgi:hypothetical protein